MIPIKDSSSTCRQYAASVALLLLIGCDASAGSVALPDVGGAVRATLPVDACARPLLPRPDEDQWLRLKRAAMTRQGLPWRDRNLYQLDHLIPRELGGADMLENLWAQPWPQARQKDLLETQMTRDFCANDRSEDGLLALQRWFATNQWSKEIKP